MIKPGTVLAGRFELVRKLGNGAMGEVWRARDRGLLSRDVAIKLMTGSPDHDLVKRFTREARVASELENPHILRVFDLGEQDGLLFIVMELLTGQDLEKEIGGRAFPIERAVDLGIQLADGLAAVHAANIVHRDLKPANIFIKSGGTLKICDFGIVRDNDELSGYRPFDSVLGTPIYVAPERYVPRNKRVEPPSDLWAVGCILYEMLTGRHPFTSGVVDLADLLSRIVNIDPEPPRRLNGQVPAPLNDAVLRLLAKDPSKRLTASQLKAVLEDIQRSFGAKVPLRPVAAPPEHPRNAQGIKPAIASPPAVVAPVIEQARPATPGGFPSGTPGKPITVGPYPENIVIAPDGTMAYVTYSGNLAPINLATGITGSPISVAMDMWGMAIAPDGKTMYIAVHHVIPVDLVKGRPGKPITDFGTRAAIALSRDGTKAYVTDDGCIEQIRLHGLPTGRLWKKILFENKHQHTPSWTIAITRDGSMAYVTRSFHRSYENKIISECEVVPINLAKGAAGKVIHVGRGIGRMAITPDGMTAYVVNNTEGSITPVTLASGILGSPIVVGNKPSAIAITPDGTAAYVVNEGDDTVTPVRLSDGIPGPAIKVGERPTNIAITPDGQRAFVVNKGEGSITPINGLR